MEKLTWLLLGVAVILITWYTLSRKKVKKVETPEEVVEEVSEPIVPQEPIISEESTVEEPVVEEPVEESVEEPMEEPVEEEPVTPEE